MEQLILVPASVHNNNNNNNNNNKSLKTQANTNLELSMYPIEQNPKYQTSSLEKEINQKLFAKADSSVNKVFSCPPIKLSNSKTLVGVGIGTGVLLPTFVL